MNVQFPHKCWSTLKSAVFGSSSSSSPLVSGGFGLVCDRVGWYMVNCLASRQSKESVDLMLTCHPFTWHITLAFRSSEVRPPLFDLVLYGGTDPLGMFPLFLKRTDVLASPHSIVFRWSLCLGNFSACYRHANMLLQFRKIHAVFCW